MWNSHRIRAQKNTVLPDGIPDHIYNFPEEYGLQECGKHSMCHYIFFQQLIKYLMTVFGFRLFAGLPVTEEQLKEVAQHSGVLEIDDDFIEHEFRIKCGSIIPMPVEQHVEPAECAEV